MRVTFLFLLLLVSVHGDELLVFLLDTSGSMRGQEQAMVDGTNKLLEQMEQTLDKMDAAASSSDSRFNVQIWTFSHQSRKLLVETVLQESPRITLDQYVAEGGTPLYDSIGQALETMPNNSTLVIATDGEDTTSTKFFLSHIRGAIKRAKEERDIQFIFIGQGEATMTAGEEVGLDDSAGSHAVYVPFGSTLGGTLTFASTVSTVQVAAFRHLDTANLNMPAVFE